LPVQPEIQRSVLGYGGRKGKPVEGGTGSSA
jgi:hypothetical protein